MAAEAGGDGRAGIGTRLRAAREKKGLTILQAAERMHADPRIVEWLEAENFTALGAAVYARGHLRHYAELLDEEPAQLQELYENSARAVPAQPDLTRIAHVPVETDSGMLAGSAVAVLITVAAAGVLWWFLNSPKEDLQPKSTQGGEQTGIVGQPAAPPAIPGAASPARTPDTRVTAVAHGAASSTEATHDATAAPGAKSGGPPHPAAPASAPTATEATVASATKNVVPAPPTTHGKDGELTLTFSSDSWAEVYDASGQRLFYDVGAASTARTVRGAVPMRVVLGNAAGVTLQFNGRPASVPSGVASDGSVRFVITARGRAVPSSDGG